MNPCVTDNSYARYGRRCVLRRTAALTAGYIALSARAHAQDAGLRSIVTIDGQPFTYAASAGQDLGDFKSDIGRFVQGCIRVMRDDCPLILYFRPDRDSERVEVVFELGRLWSGEPQNLGAYRAVIFAGDRQLASVDVPRHFWFSRWRWQSRQRPVVGDVNALISQTLLPPYDVRHREAATDVHVRYQPMDLAGISPDMPGTGERPDIGLVTEAQGRYICTGSAEALDTLRAQAEGAGALPWHMRDEKTGAPVELDVNKAMSWYEEPNVGNPHISLTKTGITIDSAHQPAVAYLPYLLTGDPYHLEDLQFAANFNRGTLPPEYRPSIPQPRSFAWSMRTLAQAAKVTPADVPSWLLPRIYWQADLSRTATWFRQAYVESRDPLRSLFRATDNLEYSRDEAPSAPAHCWIAPWMDDFLATAMGWIVLMGFDEWKPLFAWKIASTVARTNGTSGWVRAHSTPYRLIVRPQESAPIVGSWAEAWNLTNLLWKWPPSNPDEIQGQDLTYYTYTRGVLVLADRLGVQGARACLTWINDQLRQRRANVAYKWRLL